VVLEQGRAWADRYLLPMAQVADRWRLSADGITIISFAVAVLAGSLLWWGQFARPGLLALGGVLVLASAVLDAVDGRLARLQGKATARGDYLDHVVDRYADLAILLGIGLGPTVDLRITLLAVIGTLLTSYMGTQAQAVGVGRNYRGVLGRADRLLLLGVVPLAQAAWPASLAWPFGLSPLALLLLLIGVLGNVTAVQRFAAAWRELSRR
jgi:archaetidylinositol phosphate synthase